MHLFTNMSLDFPSGPAWMCRKSPICYQFYHTPNFSLPVYWWILTLTIKENIPWVPYKVILEQDCSINMGGNLCKGMGSEKYGVGYQQYVFQERQQWSIWLKLDEIWLFHENSIVLQWLLLWVSPKRVKSKRRKRRKSENQWIQWSSIWINLSNMAHASRLGQFRVHFLAKFHERDSPLNGKIMESCLNMPCSCFPLRLT